MANLENSIKLVSSLISNLSDEEFNEMLREVKSLGIEGPTFEEYLSGFENEFENQFDLSGNETEYYFSHNSSFVFDSGNTLNETITVKTETTVISGTPDFGTGFKSSDPNWSFAA